MYDFPNMTSERTLHFSKINKSYICALFFYFFGFHICALFYHTRAIIKNVIVYLQMGISMGLLVKSQTTFNNY
jgi:hypothetical protein